ncbi:MAG: hypothetical protein FJ253_03050 [Phycisphaerae bacterium]|nr:hypothetical protein [Phycisphaerae bacterium]
MHDNPPVTELLRQSRQGTHSARERAFAIVYDDLKRVAANMLRHGFRRSTLMQTTMLVNSAVERLLERGALDAQNRRHLFMLLGRAMHDVLVEEARRNGSIKRGGDRRPVPLTAELPRDAPDEPVTANELEELCRALDELAGVDPDAAEVIRLRFYCGRTLDETAELMESTLAGVRTNWEYGRAWLAERLGGEPPTA